MKPDRRKLHCVRHFRRSFITQDANWNVTTLVGTDGQVKERFLYTSYGERTVLDANWNAVTDQYGFLYGHQGGRQDPATGLIHFQARDYNPTLGRWMQQDPAGYVDGMSLYQFVEGCPVNLIDSTGLSIKVEGPTVIGKVAVTNLLRGDIKNIKEWGLTSFTPFFLPKMVSVTSKKIKCNCNGRPYAYKVTVHDHWKPDFTIKVTMSNLFLDAQSKKTADSPKALQAAVNAWNAHTRAHEQHHVNAAKAIYVPFDTIGIGIACSEREAIKKATVAAFQQKNERVKAMNDKYDKVSAAFDKADIPAQDKLLNVIRHAWSRHLGVPATQR